MKLCMTLTLAFIIGSIAASTTNAMIRYEDRQHKKPRDITVAGFIDYAPFGTVIHKEEKMNGTFTTVYQPVLDDMAKENNLKIIYNTSKMTYPDLVQKVRSGNVDILIGAYHETELYKGLDFVFPSILSNPITVFMLPSRINEVDNMGDLKKLKGIRSSKEYYTDFVVEQLKPYNLELADNSYEMFEKLFTKKVDYILAGQYYGLMEASKLGLRDQISVAKQTLWKMPLFIGVSKLSQHRKMLMQKFTNYSERPENQEKIKQYLIKTIDDFDKANDGVVPPTFGMEN